LLSTGQLVYNYATGNEKVFPDFMTRFVDADPSYINKRIGVDLDGKKMAALLCRMQAGLELFTTLF
jgi:hypothetical protein